MKKGKGKDTGSRQAGMTAWVWLARQAGMTAVAVRQDRRVVVHDVVALFLVYDVLALNALRLLPNHLYYSFDPTAH